MIALVLAAVLIGCVAAGFWLDRRYRRNGEWHSTGSSMRRYVDGEWETREMTEAEANEYKDRSVW
jgi:ABC-type Fe3+ transport system permease subunit